MVDFAVASKVSKIFSEIQQFINVDEDTELEIKAVLYRYLKEEK